MDRGTAAPLANFLENRKAILKITDGDRLEGEGMQNVQVEIARTESSRRRNAAQGKLLLVALLENYCMLYDQSKEQNQQLFFMLCQYLARMGMYVYILEFSNPSRLESIAQISLKNSLLFVLHTKRHSRNWSSKLFRP